MCNANTNTGLGFMKFEEAGSAVYRPALELMNEKREGRYRSNLLEGLRHERKDNVRRQNHRVHRSLKKRRTARSESQNAHNNRHH
jgi:hypothetical protein